MFFMVIFLFAIDYFFLKEYNQLIIVGRVIFLEKRINRSLKVFPWYMGFTGDLLFYIAIDTLFLTFVKGFSAAEIVLLTTVSQFTCIVLEFPVLYIRKKIGNTYSARTGAFLLLLSSVLITFGPNWWVVLVGRISHDLAAMFRNSSIVTLENNLKLVDRRNDFVTVRTSGNTVYSVITMLISFVASFMFNANNYLPMYGCITTCFIGFVLSLYIKDYSNDDKPAAQSKKNKVKVGLAGFIVLAVIVYGIFYPVVTSGQNEGKLFIQQEVNKVYDVETTALILGAMVCVSRVVRVLSNMIFAKVYRKCKDLVGIGLTVMLCASMACLAFGSFIPLIIPKIIIMTLGYIIILFARDPFNLYMQDVMFDNTPNEQHHTLLSLLAVSTKLGNVGLGLAFSAILLKFPMIVVMWILFIIAAIEVLLSLKLYKMVVANRNKASSCEC